MHVDEKREPQTPCRFTEVCFVVNDGSRVYSAYLPLN